jgi:hypothetical protein
MKAWRFRRYGPPDVLTLDDVPDAGPAIRYLELVTPGGWSSLRSRTTSGSHRCQEVVQPCAGVRVVEDLADPRLGVGPIG